MNFQSNVYRTTQERISMVLHPDCPIDMIIGTAKDDTEIEVIIACAQSKKSTTEIKNIVAKRLNITESKLENIIQSYTTFHKAGCVLPWIHAATNANGSVRICCQMIYNDRDMPYGSVYKNNKEPVTTNDNVDNFRNAKNWLNVRKTMLEGKYHDACRLCWDEEKNQISSKRQYVNKIYKDKIVDIVLKTDIDGKINVQDFPIKYWDLRFGNKCNLKCRSCGPNDSDQWYNDWINLGYGTSFQTKDGDIINLVRKNDFIETPSIFKWVDNKKFIENITENVHNIDRFYFTGGEPTINNTHRYLLDLLIDTKVAGNITLEYNTNMASIPDTLFNQWSEFKEIKLGMSIDGIKSYFEYIRHPAKWQKTEKLIKKIDTDYRLQNTTAMFTVTLSIMNVLHFLDMLQWHKDNNFTRIDKKMLPRNLYGPEFYNIVNLPIEVKEIIKNKYENFLLKIQDSNDTIWKVTVQRSLKGILSHLYSAKPNEFHLMKYFERQILLDKIRNEKAIDKLGDITNILSKYSYDVLKKYKDKHEIEY